MPLYLAMGVSYERFMDSCPIELRPFELAHTNRTKMLDTEMFMMGRYVYEAAFCAVDNALRGAESQARYRTKSIMEEAEEEKKRADIERQNMLFINFMDSMKVNFELKKKRENGGEE